MCVQHAEPYPYRQVALAREAQLIRHHHPAGNVQQNTRARPGWDARVSGMGERMVAAPDCSLEDVTLAVFLDRCRSAHSAAERTSSR